MTNPAALPRTLIVFGLLVPLALLVGYLLATPDRMLSLAGVGLVILVALLPILLRWHHSILIITWNMAITVFFLPGQPSFWHVMAMGSLGIAFLDWLLTKKQTFLHVPQLTWSLLALALATVVTGKITGGFGLRSLGGDAYGGKQYFIILFAIIGYFALAFKTIPPSSAKWMSGLFFASGLTPIVSNLAYYGGSNFYFLFWFFPVGYAFQQAQADWSVGSGFARLGGFSAAGQALIIFLLARYGIRGLFQLAKPWRWLFFFGLLFITLLGGFRSSIVILGTTAVALFFFEKLYRTRFVIGAIAFVILGGALLIANATKLPMAVQRSLTILPIEVDPYAKFSADNTTEWRLRMWSYLLPEVPKHLIKPKGFSIDPTEMYLVQEGIKRGINEDIEGYIVTGVYHSGPLSLALGLGIWGIATFGWFCVAALIVLYRNYRASPPELATINTLLLAYFIARLVYFIVVFGHFSEDLFVFTGLVGLSVSLNGGVRKQVSSLAPEMAPQAESPGSPQLLPQPST